MNSLRRLRRKPHRHSDVGMSGSTTRHELVHDCPCEAGGRRPGSGGVVRDV